MIYFFKKMSDRLAAFLVIAAGFFIPISTSLMIFFFTTASILVLLAGSWKEKINYLKRQPALYFPLIFLFVWILGVFYSSAAWLTRWHELKAHFYLLSIPLLAWVFRDPKVKRRAWYSFILAMTAVLVLSYLKFYLHIIVYDNPRAVGDPAIVFHDHINIGILMSFFTLSLIYFIPTINGKLRYLFYLIFFLALWYMLFMNLGRTAAFVFISSFLLIGWQWKKWKGLSLGMAIAAATFFTMFYFSPYFSAKTRAAAQDYQAYMAKAKRADDTASLRLAAMKSGLILIKNNPIKGVGTGAFYQEAILQSGLPVESLSPTAYNDFIYTAAQLGLIGFIALLALYGIQWFRSFSLSPLYARTAQLLCVTMLLGGFFNTVLRDVVEAYFYAYFSALLYAYSPRKIEAPEPVKRR